MLPNFRKSENEPLKSGIASAPPSFSQTRPIGAPMRTAERGQPSIIGPSLQITGNLVSQGEIQIEGEVHGDIHASHVLVGERAEVTGGIIADEIVVRGHVMGSIRGKRVLLQSTAHVEGDVYHQTLAIEQGTYFEGKSRRTENPTAGFSRAETAPPAPPVEAAPPAPPTLEVAPELPSLNDDAPIG